MVEGVYKLNLAFVANLFNNHPSLDKPDISWEQVENIEETREEKSKYRIMILVLRINCINLLISIILLLYPNVYHKSIFSNLFIIAT